MSDARSANDKSSPDAKYIYYQYLAIMKLSHKSMPELLNMSIKILI